MVWHHNISERKPRRILVVDDNKDSANSLAKLLQMTGNDVRTAYDAGAALEIVASFQPEAVLLDIGLPEMDGYEVARRIRLMPGAGKVVLIAISGYGTEEDQQRSYQAGFARHLTKPVRFQVLQEALAALLPA